MNVDDAGRQSPSEREKAMTATTMPPGKKRWGRRLLLFVALPIAILVGLFFAAGGYGIVNMLRKPSAPFDAAKAPPAPDYAQPTAWMAFPGENGMERSTPPGMTPVDETKAPVDVFFIHPTTVSDNTVWNAAYDTSNSVAKLNPPVLLDQLSVFNGCCRLYAPQYRQASLAGLNDAGAFGLAYADVARAFAFFIAHHSHGRPFIIASHSQGTGIAVRLLQEQVLGTPLQARMVAAYLIGGYVPDAFTSRGLPTCDAPRQTGCVLSYNTAKPGWKTARIVITPKTYWTRGVASGGVQLPAICVNPLSWRADGAAPATSNPGSLPFPNPPFPEQATTLAALTPQLTGAACRGKMLEVDIPASAPAGFHDTLSRFLGSYHLNDYGIFYASLRRNAVDRVDAWMTAHPADARPDAIDARTPADSVS